MEDNTFWVIGRIEIVFDLFCLLHPREWNSDDPDGLWTFNPQKNDSCYIRT